MHDTSDIRKTTPSIMSCMSNSECSNHGICNEKDDKLSCVCDENFTGTHCENCEIGMIKTNDGKCIPKECVDEEGLECSQSGKCDISKQECICDTGYTGPICEDCTDGFTQHFDLTKIICLPEACFVKNAYVPCSNSGECITVGGSSHCECKFYAQGEFCQNCADGFQHHRDGSCVPDECYAYESECAYNGTCVKKDGGYACECEHNFDPSTKCQKCSLGFQEIGYVCISDCCLSNGEVCNTYGTCELEDKVNKVYKCACEKGYQGNYCEECDSKQGFISADYGACAKQECIINNTQCSNNGLCVEGATGWACKCRAGSSGPLCDNCDVGYDKTIDHQCISSTCVEDSLECSGNGKCLKSPSDFQCMCKENFDFRTKCKNCLKGFYKLNGDCIEEEIAKSCKLDSDCSNHGICNETCECFSNYSGLKCEKCVSDSYQQVNGLCLEKCDTTCGENYQCKEDEQLKIKLCQCTHLNTNPDKNCMVCNKGFQSTNIGICAPISCVKNGELCGNSGTCTTKNDQFSCVCKDQFTGTYCENCKNGMTKTYNGICLPEECLDHDGEECSGFGKCDIAKKECKCDHGYAGKTCGDCNIGFRKQSDYPKSICQADVCFAPDSHQLCSNNGKCVTEGLDSRCECESNAYGEYCQICAEGLTQLDDGYCVPKFCETNGSVCNNHGDCIDTEGVFACDCEDNFDVSTNCLNCLSGFQNVDSECVVDSCVQDGLACSSYGYCELVDDKSKIHKCVCEEGHDGEYCEKCDVNLGFTRVDSGQCVKNDCVTNNTQCNNNGTCEETDAGWACRCHKGSTGILCDKCGDGYDKTVDNLCLPSVCVENDLQCNGNGQCLRILSDFQCVCNENFDIITKCKDCLKGFYNLNGDCIEEEIAKSCKLDSDCSNHGICNETCECLNNYSGLKCEKCASEKYQQFYGFCFAKCDVTCPENFECKVEQTLNINICQCKDDKANPDENCETCFTGFRMTDKGCQPTQCVKHHELCGNTGT